MLLSLIVVAAIGQNPAPKPSVLGRDKPWWERIESGDVIKLHAFPGTGIPLVNLVVDNKPNPLPVLTLDLMIEDKANLETLHFFLDEKWISYAPAGTWVQIISVHELWLGDKDGLKLAVPVTEVVISQDGKKVELPADGKPRSPYAIPVAYLGDPAKQRHPMLDKMPLMAKDLDPHPKRRYHGETCAGDYDGIRYAEAERTWKEKLPPAMPAVAARAQRPVAKAHLRLDDSFEVFIPAFPSLAAFELMLKDVRESGDEALEKLRHDEKVWGVENYAAIEILDTDTGNDLAIKVRILDGAFEDRIAFVLRNCVSQGPPPMEAFPEHGYSFKEKRKIMAAWLHMSHVADNAPGARKDGGAGFAKAQEELLKRLGLTKVQLKEIMAELVVKRVHFGDELIEKNIQSERYIVEPSPELVPDADYVPRVGDEAYLYLGAIFKDGPSAGKHMEVFGCIDYSTFVSHEKALLAKDNEGLKGLDGQGRRVYVRTGTRIKILGFHESSGDASIRDAAEVCLLDGPFKGRKFWVLTSRIARLVPKPDVAP
jgi:hypothetical protein